MEVHRAFQDNTMDMATAQAIKGLSEVDDVLQGHEMDGFDLQVVALETFFNN